MRRIEGDPAPFRIFISAGEVSGDAVGARLVAEIRRRDSAIRVFGTGGPRMRDAGAEIFADTTHIGAVGVTEGFTSLPSFVDAYKVIRRCIKRERPDVAVLVGNDVFNVMIARWLRRRGIHTISYFPPQAWIWKWMARPIALSYDAILASFPDECATYSRVHQPGRVTYVGHYLADVLTVPTADDRDAARSVLGIARDGRLIALLPGSRRSELRRLSGVLFDSAALLLERDPTLRFVVPVAGAAGVDTTSREIATRSIAARTTICADSHTALRAADFAVVASGTASLEAALLGVPMIVVYKVSAITSLVGSAGIWCGLIDSYTLGLPNLLLGKHTVPEVLQKRANGPFVANEVWSLLSDAVRLATMRRDLGTLASRLGGGRAMGAAADTILEWASS